jgi:hypothetical protein
MAILKIKSIRVKKARYQPTTQFPFNTMVKSKFLHSLFAGVITPLGASCALGNKLKRCSLISIFRRAHRIDFSVCRWNYTMSIVVASIKQALLASGTYRTSDEAA